MDLTRERLRFSLITLLIVGVLVVQTISGFRRTYKWWPFLSYPMYADAHFEGERIEVSHRIYAVTPDGVRHYLDPDTDLKIGFWRYEKFARQIGVNHLERNAATLSAIRSMYPTLTEIQIEDYPMIITKNGPAPAPRQVINTIKRSAIDEWAK